MHLGLRAVVDAVCRVVGDDDDAFTRPRRQGFRDAVMETTLACSADTTSGWDRSLGATKSKRPRRPARPDVLGPGDGLPDRRGFRLLVDRRAEGTVGLANGRLEFAFSELSSDC